jgi:hypothetical protein
MTEVAMVMRPQTVIAGVIVMRHGAKDKRYAAQGQPICRFRS